MFEAGFFGTRAPLYMDVVGIYFMILPFLMALSIFFAAKGKITAHLKSQLVIFSVTMLMVVVFEVGMRISGGFLEYMKSSSISLTFMSIFLLIHILIALATVLVWGYSLISSIKTYKNIGMSREYKKRHKKMGRYIFLGLIITVFMGAYIYYALFIG